MIAIDSGRDRPVFKHSRERRLWLLIHAACVVPAMLDVLQAYMQAKLDGRSARWQDLVFQGSEWLFLGTLTPITYYLARRFPLRRERWKRSLAAHVLGALVLCIGWASLGVLLGLVLHRYPAQGRLPHDYVSWILTSVPWSVFMYFAVLGCVYLLRESLASSKSAWTRRASCVCIDRRSSISRRCARSAPGWRETPSSCCATVPSCH